jgi:hypothetical protein
MHADYEAVVINRTGRYKIKDFFLDGVAHNIKEARKGSYGIIISGRSRLTHVNGFMMGRATNILIQYAGKMTVCIVD